MTLGSGYAAKTPERLFISPGRTCGFAAEISVGHYYRSFGEPPITSQARGEHLLDEAVEAGLSGSDLMTLHPG
jgi:hypothetical protein